MNKVAIIIVSLILALIVVFGGCTQTAPATSSDGSVTIKPTNSESASQIAELEAKVRQLEAENQRLLAETRQLEAENQNLSDNLAKVTTQLQAVQSLVSSSSYTNTLNKLTEIQYDASELAAWAYSLPHLPPLPPGLTPGKIEQVLGMARVAYDVIYHLPPLPPFPPELAELERQRKTILEIFKFVQDLRDLPQFLNNAESLEDLRSRIETHLADVQSATSYAEDMMQQIRDATQP